MQLRCVHVFFCSNAFALSFLLHIYLLWCCSYTQNGLLHMLDRNRRIKKSPEKFQVCAERFDLIITAEERVYDQVSSAAAVPREGRRSLFFLFFFWFKENSAQFQITNHTFSFENHWYNNNIRSNKSAHFSEERIDNFSKKSVYFIL